MIKDNLIKVKENVEKACDRSGRSKESVTLIAVSKTKPVSLIKEAYAEGIRDFGENRVQELLEKYPQLPSDIRWHLIGHLQTNKVRQIIDKVFLIHSVDSLKLAGEISKEAVKKGIEVPILVEVNMAGEESKFGVSEKDTEALIRDIALLKGIKVKGLMTVAPNVADGKENAEVFRKMRQLFIDIKQKNIDNVLMESLSMGMSGDYETAIEEGASYIRVGTSIFGHRESHDI